jgi:hypothetical protein
MNENINTNEINDENNGFSVAICEDLTRGLHSVLYKRIGNVTINDVRLQNAFKTFTKLVECGESFSVAEMLMAAEKLITGGNPDINAGNCIYVIEDFKKANKRLFKKILASSVENIYMLFALKNGISIDLDLIGGSLIAGETKRFLVVDSKKYKKLNKLFQKNNIKCTKVGEMLAAERIVLTRGNDVVADVSKKPIGSGSEKVSITLGTVEFASFRSGYDSVLSTALCDTVSENNVVRFGLGGGIESVFARSLGFFMALVNEKNVPVRQLFTSEMNCTVAVSRPKVSDGDYLYLLRVRDDSFGLPDKAHFAQLKYYLFEKKRNGIIKDVLSVRDNIERIYKRLCNESLEFVTISENVEYGFGVVVSVGRGESVNGIKIGYFKTSVPVDNSREGETV